MGAVALVLVTLGVAGLVTGFDMAATGAATPVAYGRQAIWRDDHTLLVSV
jgi:hypothetical protein